MLPAIGCPQERGACGGAAGCVARRLLAAWWGEGAVGWEPRRWSADADCAAVLDRGASSRNSLHALVGVSLRQPRQSQWLKCAVAPPPHGLCASPPAKAPTPQPLRPTTQGGLGERTKAMTCECTGRPFKPLPGPGHATGLIGPGPGSGQGQHHTGKQRGTQPVVGAEGAEAAVALAVADQPEVPDRLGHAQGSCYPIQSTLRNV